MRRKKVSIPKKVIAKLGELALSGEHPANERSPALDLLTAVQAIEPLKDALLARLLTAEAMEEPLVSRIAFLFRGDPGRLLDALDGLEDDDDAMIGERIAGTLQAIAADFAEHSDAFADTTISYPLEPSGFATVDTCKNASERMRKVFDGER